MLHTEDDKNQSDTANVSQSQAAAGSILQRLGARTNSGNNNPADLEKMVEHLAVSVDQFGKANGLAMHSTLITEDPLALPVVAIHATVDNRVFIFSLLITQFLKNNAIKPIYREIHGQNVESEQPFSKLYDKALIENVCRRVVEKNTAIPTDASMVCVGSSVILDDNDITSMDVVNRYVDSAGLALLEVSGKASTFDAPGILAERLSIVNNIEVTPGATDSDVLGNPVATDFKTKLSLRQNTEQNKGYHTSAESFDLVQVNGIVDMLYYPPNHGQWGAPIQDGKAKPAYIPHVIATNISGMGAGASSQEDLLGQVLGLCSMGVMITGKEWLSIFNTPSANKASIGALGLEYDPTTGMAPKKKQALKVQQGGVPGQVADSINPAIVAHNFCHDGIAISMDVLLGGRTEWVQRTFVEAARGNKEANAAIIDVLNRFTKGAFRKVWGDAFVVQPSIGYAFAGTYPDPKTSEKADIRSFDTLKMLEASKGDDNLMMNYRGITYPAPSELAMANHKSVLRNVLTANTNGLYARITFVNEFFGAMMTAIQQAGVGITIEGLSSVDNGMGVAEYTPDRFQPIASAGSLFHYGQNQTVGGAYNFAQNNYGYGYRAFGQ